MLSNEVAGELTCDKKPVLGLRSSKEEREAKAKKRKMNRIEMR